MCHCNIADFVRGDNGNSAFVFLNNNLNYLLKYFDTVSHTFNEL